MAKYDLKKYNKKLKEYIIKKDKENKPVLKKDFVELAKKYIKKQKGGNY